MLLIFFVCRKNEKNHQVKALMGNQEKKNYSSIKMFAFEMSCLRKLLVFVWRSTRKKNIIKKNKFKKFNKIFKKSLKDPRLM
jgi:hypothetical protein